MTSANLLYFFSNENACTDFGTVLSQLKKRKREAEPAGTVPKMETGPLPSFYSDNRQRVVPILRAITIPGPKQSNKFIQLITVSKNARANGKKSEKENDCVAS